MIYFSWWTRKIDKEKVPILVNWRHAKQKCFSDLWSHGLFVSIHVSLAGDDILHILRLHFTAKSDPIWFCQSIL